MNKINILLFVIFYFSEILVQVEACFDQGKRYFCYISPKHATWCGMANFRPVQRASVECTNCRGIRNIIRRNIIRCRLRFNGYFDKYFSPRGDLMYRHVLATLASSADVSAAKSAHWWHIYHRRYSPVKNIKFFTVEANILSHNFINSTTRYDR